LPCRRFFETESLRWNGEKGIIDDSRDLCFYDPSFTQGGPSILLVNPEFLSEFLNKNGMRIIWTVLSEKLALRDNGLPRLHFSQIHTLSEKRLISSKPVIVID